MKNVVPLFFNNRVKITRTFKSSVNLANRKYSVRIFPQTAPQPHKLPPLRIIDDMRDLASDSFTPYAPNTLLVYRQHILETTGTLLKGLNQLGFQLIGTDKCYSTSPSVLQSVLDMKIRLITERKPSKPGDYQQACRENLENLWSKVTDHIDRVNIDRLVVVDDGARCCESMPNYLRLEYPNAWVEQTKGGFFSSMMKQSFTPGVAVGNSAVKRYVEAPLISRALLNRLRQTLDTLEFNKRKAVIGIIGKGALGVHIANDLLKQNYKVIIYDIDDTVFQQVDSQNLYRVNNPLCIIAHSDCILGAVGRDATESIAHEILDVVKSDKYFISCTSEDKEFLTLLKMVAERGQYGNAQDPFDDVSCLSNSGHLITIKGGGYPYNFDRQPYNVPAQDIALTQGLMFGACLQAAEAAVKPIGDGVSINKPQLQCLNPYIQRYVVRHWKKSQPQGKYSEEFFDQFEDIDWIIANSGGTHVPSPVLEQTFAHPPLPETDKSRVAYNLSK